MPTVRLTASLREEYEGLYRTCEIEPERFRSVDAIASRLLRQRDRYARVGRRSAVPWYIVAVIHNMEGGLRFDRHLHNGDLLTRRTVNVPSGRPPSSVGDPPFTWEQSAGDALRFTKLDEHEDWSVGGILHLLEGYNGWGYRRYHPEVLSPYLWSFSNHYSQGKYVADGRWSGTAASRQAGAAVLLRRLDERGEIDPRGRPVPRTPIFRYSTRTVRHADELQRFLNTLPGTRLRVDGRPGSATSAAVHKVFGSYLRGDPRAR